MPWEYIDPSGLLVDNVRQAVREAHNEDPQAFDSDDYREVLEDDWWPQRFIMECGMVEDEAKVKLINALKWRRSNNVRHLKVNQFPAEFFKMGALFLYAKDQNDRPSLYVRIKYVQRVPEFQEALKLFLVYQIQRIDQVSRGVGYVLILDFHGSSFKNCDLDLVKFLINTLRLYFPVGVDLILINELPRLLNAFWKLVKPFIPGNAQDLIKFSNYSSLRELFTEECLPDFANGGKCKLDYEHCPDGCPTIEEYGLNRLGLTAGDMKRILSKYKSIMGVK